MTDRSGAVSRVPSVIVTMPACIEDAEEIFREQLTPNQQSIYLKLEAITISDYKEIFNIFDVNNDGSISNTEIDQIMNALGESPSASEIAAMVAKIDYNQDGRIDFNEFVCMVIIQLERNEC